MNIHNPVRYADESPEAYAARRRASAQASKVNAQIGVGGISARLQLRNHLRDNGTMHKHAGAYGRGLRNWITRTQAAKIA